MTDINAVARRVQYTGNNPADAGPFSFTFQVNATTEVNVFVDGTLKTLSTHYTVTLSSSGAGSVSFTSGNFPTNSQTVTISSNVGLARSSVYTTGGPLTAAALEKDFDTQQMILQQVSQKVDRALAAPENDATSIDMELPVKADRLGKFLAFNSTTGNPEVGPSTTDVTTLASVTTDIATLADIEDGTDSTDAIQAVAAIAGNVTTVAGVASNVTTVAGISSNVTSVANDATDIGAVAGKATEIGRLGTSASVTSLGLLGTTAAVADLALLGTTAVVEDLNLLGTTAVVEDMSLLATSAVIEDMGLLATSAVIEDMGLLGTSANVTAMGVLGTSANVTAMATLSASAVVADMALLATTDVIADMALLANSDVIADLNTLATSDIVSDLNTLATSDIVSDINTLATSDIVSDLNTLATSDIVTDINLLATSAIVEDLNLLATSSVIADMASLAGGGANPNITSVTASGAITAGSFVIGSADINENDLESIDGITAGTVAASKAVVVDTNKDVTGFRNITLTGELDAGSLDVSGDANIAGEVQTTKIAFTDGDDAMTITDTGLVEFNTGFNVGSDASGDILYNNGSKYVRLAKGTDGQSLTLASGIPSWASGASASGSSSIVTTGALDSGSITSGFGNINIGSSTITTTGDISGGTVNATSDTSAGDNAAIGYTAAEGLILTGQGSTSDITLKNDADATVFTVPTGTDDILFPDNAKAMFGNSSDLQIYHSGGASHIDDVGTGDFKISTDGTGIYLNKGGSESMASFLTDGAVTLYHNNAAKLATESGGVNVTGYLDADNFKINGAQGSDGQVLTSTGSGVAWEDASGGGGMYELVTTTTMSGASSAEFTVSYDRDFYFTLENLSRTSGTGGITLQAKGAGDSGFGSYGDANFRVAYFYFTSGGSHASAGLNSTEVTLSQDNFSETNDAIYGHGFMRYHQANSKYAKFDIEISNGTGTTTALRNYSSGLIRETNQVTTLKIFPAGSGNINGIIRQYRRVQ